MRHLRPADRVRLHGYVHRTFVELMEIGTADAVVAYTNLGIARAAFWLGYLIDSYVLSAVLAGCPHGVFPYWSKVIDINCKYRDP
jgi:hypothetical protein